jgi:transcriptional regulator with XRE-family HTH domain
MPRQRTNPPDKPPRKLYLGPWIARLGLKQGKVAEDAGISPQFMSELISGSKKPSVDTLLDISDILGVPVNSLYFPPPAAGIVQSLQGITPAALDRLTHKRR